MPTYEYACPTCGTVEAEQRISEAALTACPSCGAPVKRLISRSSFALKGGGWYSEGYGSSGQKPPKGGASEASGGGGCGAGACGTGACAGGGSPGSAGSPGSKDLN
jgi:putative FmdB family regulatory protein